MKEWTRSRHNYRTQPVRRNSERHSAFLRISRIGLMVVCSLALLVSEPHATQRPLPDASISLLHTEVRDAGNRQRVAARCYLTDESGKPWTPAAAFTYDKRQEHHFITQGTFDIAVPPGRYLLRVERGPEYQPWESRLTLQAGKTHSETVQLTRWIDMNRRGWYSGDLHNHRPPDQIDQLLLAEDLNLAPVLADWVWDDGQRSNRTTHHRTVQKGRFNACLQSSRQRSRTAEGRSGCR